MKKTLNLFLIISACIALIISISISGCTSQQTTETTVAAETTEAAETTAKTEAATSGEKPFEGRTLKIHWAVFAPADALQKMVDEVFTPLTGIKVIVEQTPWSDFTAKYNAELIAGGDAWDIIIGDSQDVGNGAVNGHYVDLTQFVEENGLKDKFTPATLSSFGEYPAGSGKFYGVPVLTDPTHFAYRMDLFDDPKIKEDFKAKTGMELGIPKDWEEIITIAEYFRDNVEGMYGIAVYGDNGYDSLNMFAETAIWCYGGDLGDFNTMQVKGIINGEGSIAGIEAYRKLFLCTPPGHGTAFYEENNNVYLSGLVPMVFNYTSTLPALTNKETNPYAENTGFFMTPPGKGPDGKTYQGTSLGGQGANIVKYSKNQDIAIEWLKWWCLDETQKLYSTYPGCFNGSYAIIEDPDFATASPLNQIAMDSCAILKDWWNVPEYAQTVRSFADTVGKYVIGGEGTAKEALDKVAEEWNQVFEEAGYYK